jgi:hypothetical protein
VSYDLTFWKSVAGTSPIPPFEIYKALMQGAAPAGLVEFPVDDFLERLERAFPGFERHDHEAFREGADGEGVIEAGWSPRHMRVDFRRCPHSTMNRVIEIGYELGVPAYDPQVDERFDSWAK